MSSEKMFECVVTKTVYDDDNYGHEVTREEVWTIQAYTIDNLYFELACAKVDESPKERRFHYPYVTIEFGDIREIAVHSQCVVSMEMLKDTEPWKAHELLLKKELERLENDKKMREELAKQRELAELQRLQEKYGNQT